MGRSEWGFHIKSKNDAMGVINLVLEHNKLLEDVGEELEVFSIIQCNKTTCYYLCIGNGGGGEQTTNFITKNYKKGLVYYPFQKPKWWNDEDKYTVFWTANSYDEAMKPEKYVITPWD